MKPLPCSKSPHGEPPYQPNLWNNYNQHIKATHNCYTYMLNDLYYKPRIHGKPQPGYFSNDVFFNGMNSYNRLSCKVIETAVIKDNPHLEVLSLQKGRKIKCPANCYKGFMIVSPGNDYHFARQDNRMIKVYRKIHNDVIKQKIKIPFDTNDIIELFLKYTIKYIPEIVRYIELNTKNNNSKEKLKSILKYSKLWSHKPGGTNATDKDADDNLIIDPEKANWDYSKNGGVNYNIKCCYFIIPSNNIALTYSSGISYNKNPKKNSPFSIRSDLSVDISIDNKYENLIKTICK